MVPQPNVVSRPSNDVTSKTEQTLRNQELKKQGVKQAYGWDDRVGGQRAVYDEKGQLIREERAIRRYIKQETTINGKPVGIRPPPNLQPLPLGQEQQAAALPPAITGLFSPDSSIASKDSGFVSLPDGEQSDMQGEEGRSSEHDKDKDDRGSNDSGNDSQDDMDTN